MTDVRHRDVYRVWYHIYLGLGQTSSEYAHLLYAVDHRDAIERAGRQLARMMPEEEITITRAEKR